MEGTGMKSRMEIAGYKHLTTQSRGVHRLKCIETGTVEIWQTTRDSVGICYKNSHLRFIDIDTTGDNIGEN